MIGRVGRLLRAAARRAMPGRKPDFLVLGAQKCGTSTLHHLLSQHPALLGSTPKEIHYFDRWVHAGRSIRWYESHFKSLDPRIRARFESTPSYIYSADVADRLLRYSPALRFVLVLREPVARAFSAWNMFFDMVRRGQVDRLRWPEAPDRPGVYRSFVAGRERFATFEEAVEVELELIRDQGPPLPALLRQGLYARQLEAYFERFPRDRFLIFGSQDLKRRRDETMRRICRHVGVAPFDLARADVEPLNVRPYAATLDPATRARLEAFFHDENERLFDLLGERLDW